MTDMEHVKDAIGEHHPALAGAPRRGNLGRADLRGGVQSG
jgi:hypothetical protein